MAHVQITDLNSSDFGLMEELTEEELLEINGGGWFSIVLFEGFIGWWTIR
jgi:hypothetical protein